MSEAIKYAVIADDNETVEAVRKWIPGRQPNEAVRVTDKTGVAGPGFTWDGRTFTAPPEPEIPPKERMANIKRQCERTIKAILDDNTVKNLFGAVILNRLNAEDKATFSAGQTWVGSMIAECRRAIADGDDPSWPDAPDGLQDLAEKY